MVRSREAITACLITAAVLAVLSGCSPREPSLEGTQWRLTGWTLSSLNPSEFTITAAFGDGQISGNSGVNSYGGSYTAGAGGEFSVGQLASTLMAGDEAAMRAEAAYLELLGGARSFSVAEGTLTLYDEGGNESLIFGN